MAKKIKIDADGLMVELTAEAGTTVSMTVSNTTGARKIFCTYHTPFEGIRNEIFEVTNAGGDEIPYAGMMAKRAAPGPEDYVTLANGAFESAEVDLTDGYDLETPGDYTVKFAGNMISGLEESNEVRVTVGG
jgi:peptidyl-Lys metalloendopeptidase